MSRLVNSTTLSDLLAETSAYFQIAPQRLTGRDRQLSVAIVRQIFMYLARKWLTYSLEEIGEAIGGRDHSTVLHGCKKVEALVRTPGEDNERLARQIYEIERRAKLFGTKPWPIGDNEPVELFLPAGA